MGEMSAYGSICAEFYDRDKPGPPAEDLAFYHQLAGEAEGPILEPMCGSGRFLVPLLRAGFDVDGFDLSWEMLDRCREKCEKEGFRSELIHGSFANAQFERTYRLIFIPSGSFNLLIKEAEVKEALKKVVGWLSPGGRFVFELETVKVISPDRPVKREWQGRWVTRPDGSKLVLSWLEAYDETTRVFTSIDRYEVWVEEKIIRTEVEQFDEKLYEASELDAWIKEAGFTTIEKSQCFSGELVGDEKVLLYVCTK